MEVLTEDCGRCGGSGELNIKLGKPDPNRDTHTPYTGVWCVYPPVPCGACKATGQRPVKPNPAAGYRIHMDVWGWVTGREQFTTVKPEVPDTWNPSTTTQP